MAIPKHKFEKLTKPEWLEIIEKSMKSGSVDRLSWQIDEDLEGLVFAHQEDVSYASQGFHGSSDCNEWLIGVDFHHGDKPNSAVFDGVKAVRVDLSTATPDTGQLSFFLGNGYDCNFVIQNKRDLTSLLDQLSAVPAVGEDKNRKLEGSIVLSDLSNWDLNLLYGDIHESLPGFGLCISIPKSNKKGDNISNLSQTFVQITKGIESLADDSPAFSWLFDNVRFEYNLSSDFLYEIAVIRALKLLWLNFQKAFGLKPKPLKLMATIDMESLTDKPNDQLILATNAALASVIGGVHAMMILRTQNDDIPLDRLVKNIQLILKKESNMSLVSDPASGSYAIEDLTARIAARIWSNL